MNTVVTTTNNTVAAVSANQSKEKTMTHDEIENLRRRLEKLEGAPAREHPALGEAERIAQAKKLADLRAERIGEARDLRKKTEAALIAADAAIKAARRKLSDIEDTEIVAGQAFAAEESVLRISLRRGAPDCIREFRARLSDEDAATREESLRNGVYRVSPNERIAEDQRLSHRRRLIAEALELVETLAELPESEARLRQRFEALVSGLPALTVVQTVQPTRIVERPTHDPKTIAEGHERTWQTNPRNVTFS